MTLSKMTRRTEEPPYPRPHAAYRDELIARILTLEPDSILDVGCGEGGMLLSLDGRVKQRIGLDPDARAVAVARSQGVDARVATAGKLPFGDRSVDVVTMAYVTHHVDRPDQCLAEAMRVARLGVAVLDCWYDRNLPCQRVAHAFDGWMKRIDRRLGYVHYPCPDVSTLLSAFAAHGGFLVDCSTHLLLRPVPLGMIEARARQHLELVDDAELLGSDLVRLLDDARLHGVSDDGALIVLARREERHGGQIV